MSRKLWMAIFATLLLWSAYERSLNHLYALPDAKIWAWAGVTQTFLHAVAAIAMSLLGIMGVVSMASLAKSSVSKVISETIDGKPRPRDFEDTDEPLQ